MSLADSELVETYGHTVRALSPTRRQRRHNRTTRTISHKTFIDQIIAEKLVRPVHMRVHWANRLEEPCLSAGRDGNGFAAAQNLCLFSLFF